MAKNKFQVEVLTPEGQVFSDEVMPSSRTTTGPIGVLANHAPLMGILEPTELRLYKSESDVVSWPRGRAGLQAQRQLASSFVEDKGPARPRLTAALESKLKEVQWTPPSAPRRTREERVAPSARSSATRPSSRRARTS